MSPASDDAQRPREAAATDEPATLPTASRDEQPTGWGDERDDECSDDARLSADRPPHHDRWQ